MQSNFKEHISDTCNLVFGNFTSRNIVKNRSVKN